MLMKKQDKIKSLERHLKVCRGAFHIGANEGGERGWYEKMGFERVFWF